MTYRIDTCVLSKSVKNTPDPLVAEHTRGHLSAIIRLSLKNN